jgi:hypothetical protein
MHMCWKRKQGLNKTTLPHEIMGIHNCTQRFMHSCDNTPASSHIKSCIHRAHIHCWAKVFNYPQKYLSEVLTGATKVGCYIFDLRFLVHMTQVISKISLVLHSVIWATEGPRKNRSLSAVLFWQILPLFVFASRSLSFWVILIREHFEEVATVVDALICGGLELKPEPKWLIYYHTYANVVNRIVLSFVWRKFSSVGIREWWDEMKNGKKLKIGDAHATPPRNIQELQASKLGDAPEAPLLHRQKSSHHSRHYIFIASCIMHFSWSVFTFALLATINGWITSCLFWRETYSVFHCQEHSSFHSFCSTSVLFF